MNSAEQPESEGGLDLGGGDEIEKQGGGIGLLGRWYDACTGTVIYFIKGFGHLRMVLKAVGPVRCVKCT